MFWYKQLSARNRRMFVGLIILTLAQFGPWQHSTEGSQFAMAGIGSGAPVFSAIAVTSGNAAVSGWGLHQLAILILPILLIVYALDRQFGTFWQKWGLWITLALMAYCATFVPSIGDYGAFVGWVGILISASAFLVKHQA